MNPTAQRNAESTMFAAGLQEIMWDTKMSSKTRRYATAIYFQSIYRRVVDFTFTNSGKLVRSETIEETIKN